jgi:hypothetical protein
MNGYIRTDGKKGRKKDKKGGEKERMKLRKKRNKTGKEGKKGRTKETDGKRNMQKMSEGMRRKNFALRSISRAVTVSCWMECESWDTRRRFHARQMARSTLADTLSGC